MWHFGGTPHSFRYQLDGRYGLFNWVGRELSVYVPSILLLFSSLKSCFEEFIHHGYLSKASSSSHDIYRVNAGREPLILLPR